jgi:UrcA family protein
MTCKTTLITLALAAALAASATNPALANAPEIKTQKVGYADLDLSREAGARVLLMRIRNAAAAVCSDGAQSPLQLQSRAYRSCIHQASAQAVTQADSPMVTALYGHQPPIALAQK